VTEAIEEAVRMLIIEGLRENLWAAAENTDPGQLATLFAAYAQETAAAERFDAFGRDLSFNRSGFGVSVGASGGRLESDYADVPIRPAAEFAVRARMARRLSVGFAVTAGGLAAGDALDNPFVAAEALGRYDLLPEERFTPFVHLGAGALGVPDAPSGETFFGYMRGGGGFEYMLTRRTGLSLSVSDLYPFTEGLDGVVGGGPHDNVLFLQAGLTLYGL
jgi:curli production assembly/transport component CsgG